MPKQQKELHEIHGGTWFVRYAEAKGIISKEDADRRVKELRRTRKQRGKADAPIIVEGR